MRRAAAALALGAVLAGFGIGRATATAEHDRHQVTITVESTCAEDEPYLRGRGDFDGTTWARYACVHIDEIGGKR